MLHVTLRGLQGHVLRLILTACAVMLGVSFVTGTFVLRDSIDNTLGGLVAQSSKGAGRVGARRHDRGGVPSLRRRVHRCTRGAAWHSSRLSRLCQGSRG